MGLAALLTVEAMQIKVGANDRSVEVLNTLANKVFPKVAESMNEKRADILANINEQFAQIKNNVTQAARDFAARWKGKGDEKSETEKFWLTLLRDVCGVAKPDEIIEFEKRAELEHKSFIDAYIAQTHVLIKQKSAESGARYPAA